MASTVLFADMAFARYEASQTLPEKFSRMLEKTPLADRVSGKTVAIKMHVGGGVNYSTIPSVFAIKLVDFIKARGGDCFITDHYIKDRKPETRGYGESVLGCPVLECCGHLNKYFYEIPVDFKTLKRIDVAGLVRDADFMVDFSHVKGHGACGFGGACKNIAMGCVTDRTRQEIHALEGGLLWDAGKCTHCGMCVESCNHHANSFDKDGVYDVFYHHCTLCQHCLKVCPTGAITLDSHGYEDFQTGMALCTKTVVDTFAPGNVYYINVLTAITALCDCWGMTTPSLVPDIGIMASENIVALERACLDAIKIEDLISAGVPTGMELTGAGHLFERLHGKDPYIQLDKLEEAGLGGQDYKLVKVE